jgi:PAS domain S-box-containing protein
MIKLNGVDKKGRVETVAVNKVKMTGDFSFEKEVAGADLLGSAFLSFNNAAESLERHYGYLEEKVARLDRDLLEKSVALEKSLQKSSDMECYQANILKSLPSGVVVMDLSGKVISYNKKAEEICGCFNREAIGKRVVALLNESVDSSGFSSGFRPPVSEKEVTYLSESGERLFLKISTTLFLVDGGRRDGTVCILNDITREKMLEKGLERSKRLAAMGEMAASLAHEIRNPLGGIELIASNLSRNLRGDMRARKMAEDICSGVASLNHIVTNIQQFARVEKPEMAEMFPCDAIDDAIISALHLIERSGVELRKDLRSSSVVTGNRELMKQAFLNIILNALQAMEGGGRLHISMENRDNEKVEIIFKDSGGGMPQAVKNSAFEPFYSTKERGSGLGLAIVRNIIDLHGGTVEIESESGEGTAVIIVLDVKN